MKKQNLALISCLLFSSLSFAATDTGELKAGATLSELTEQYPVHWVSVEQVIQGLKSAPLNVGFDIDDTLLYSSPGFFHGKQKYSPESDDYLNKQEFWNEVSGGWDRFAIPKKSAIKLIKYHMGRGDNIYFITGRPAPDNGKEDVTATLRDYFKIPEGKLNKVIFAGTDKDAKVKYIKNNGISVYYGDSDNDILDARKAGAEGIRVLRPLNSTNSPEPRNGQFGERVIINSQY